MKHLNESIQDKIQKDDSRGTESSFCSSLIMGFPLLETIFEIHEPRNHKFLRLGRRLGLACLSIIGHSVHLLR